jgi:hypothetical protein
VCGSTPLGHDPQQGFSKPVGFIKAESWDGDDEHQLSGKTSKMDKELEQEQKEARRCDEDNSFRDVCCIKFMLRPVSLVFVFSSANTVTSPASIITFKLLSMLLPATMPHVKLKKA